MRITTIMGAAALSMAAATAANAAVTIGEAQEGDTFVINFTGLNGDPVAAAPELSAILNLTFTDRSDDGLTYAFTYTLENDSTVESRIRSFGFNTDGDVGGAVGTGTYSNAGFGNNFPVGIGNLDVCFRASGGNNCTGGPNGLTQGMAENNGSFTLTLAGATDTLTLSDFTVRYQSINPALNNSTSGVGIETMGAVPEPATWLMLILGFAAVGGTMRNRKTATKVSFAI